MLELYNAPQSTCAQKVHGAREKGLEFVEHKLKLSKNDQLGPISQVES